MPPCLCFVLCYTLHEGLLFSESEQSTVSAYPTCGTGTRVLAPIASHRYDNPLRIGKRHSCEPTQKRTVADDSYRLFRPCGKPMVESFYARLEMAVIFTREGGISGIGYIPPRIV